MILLQELEGFCDQWKTERSLMEKWYMVASDDELNRLYKDDVNANSNFTFVAIIPTHDANINDEDNRRLRNNVYFMCIKKTDTKAGHDAKLAIFKSMQFEALALLKKIVDLHHNFGQNCVFRDIDLNSIRIDPVQDYLGANGYQIEFSTLTKF